MKARVFKDEDDDGYWRWECSHCPYTSSWNNWAVIFDMAFKHISRHQYIGFRRTNG